MSSPLLLGTPKREQELPSWGKCRHVVDNLEGHGFRLPASDLLPFPAKGLRQQPALKRAMKVYGLWSEKGRKAQGRDYLTRKGSSKMLVPAKVFNSRDGGESCVRAVSVAGPRGLILRSWSILGERLYQSQTLLLIMISSDRDA